MSDVSSRCAVIAMELQRGIVGDLSAIGPLRDVVQAEGVIGHTRTLLTAARQHHIPVVHCTVEFRADRRGSGVNAPLLAYMAGLPGHIESGTAAAEIVPELAPRADDFVIARLHGISPFTGTSLDMTLRHLGVDCVVVAGVSLNLGVLGLAIEAVNLGYRVVVAEDAVAGFPADYVAQLKRYTLRHIARLLPVEQVIAQWSAGTAEETGHS